MQLKRKWKCHHKCKPLKAQSNDCVTFCKQWKTHKHVFLSLFPWQWDMDYNTVYFYNILQLIPTYCFITLIYLHKMLPCLREPFTKIPNLSACYFITPSMLKIVWHQKWVWSICGMILMGLLKYSKKNMSKCHSVHHTSQMYWLSTGPGT